MKKTNKKPLIALGIMLLVGIIGGTISYFTSSTTIPNTFKTETYKTVTTEEFISPSSWTPGTTTSKTVTVKNEGNVPVAVRVSYTEAWVSKNGSSLPLQPTGLSQPAAILNLNTTGWIKNGNYYYYNKAVKNGETSPTFLNSVTYNPQAPTDIQCTTQTTSTGTTHTCESSGNGYDGATYTLTITVETIQYDAYQTAWTNAVTIAA